MQRAAMGDFLRRMHRTLSGDEFEELLSYLDEPDRVAEELMRASLPNRTGGSLPSALAPHDWDFVGACFFCFTAATTIGYGNYTPQTWEGKLFLVFYSLFAIPACLNAFAQVTDRALDVLARRFRRRQVFDKRIGDAFEMFDLDRSGKLERSEVRKAMRVLGYDLNDTSHGREMAARFEDGFSLADPDGDGALDVSEFRVFVLSVAPDAAAKIETMLSKGYVVLLALGIFFFVVTLSTIIFGSFYEAESWTPLDAFYFTVVTFTTIGFGDFSPDPHPGWFAAIFIMVTFLGLGITATLVRAASDPAFNTWATIRSLAPRRLDRLETSLTEAASRLSSVFGLDRRHTGKSRPKQARVPPEYRSPGLHGGAGRHTALDGAPPAEECRPPSPAPAPTTEQGFV